MESNLILLVANVIFLAFNIYSNINTEHKGWRLYHVVVACLHAAAITFLLVAQSPIN